MSNFHPEESPKTIVKTVPTVFCGHCGARLEQANDWKPSFYCECSIWYRPSKDSVNRVYELNDATYVERIPESPLEVLWSYWRSVGAPLDRSSHSSVTLDHSDPEDGVIGD